MQNKNVVIIGGALVVGLGAYFLMGGPGTNPETAMVDTKPKVETVTTVKDGEPIATTTKVAEVKDKTINTNTTKTKMTEQNIGGMVMVDEVVGQGAEAKSGDSVTVHYVGSLTNGTVFDASKNHGDQGFTFALGAGQVIKGWDVGVAGMKVGGKRKLTIPADMAYGNQAVGGVIPANSTLEFEVELLKVGK